ncbi:hypothetical protein [Microbacterium sp. MMO-10]|uniref:hypothetical protein n=1 Tax=Microbacterium sp. MMO-10 TaxID=3081272 RepID=UPI0030175095
MITKTIDAARAIQPRGLRFFCDGVRAPGRRVSSRSPAASSLNDPGKGAGPAVVLDAPGKGAGPAVVLDALGKGAGPAVPLADPGKGAGWVAVLDDPGTGATAGPSSARRAPR